MPSNLLLRTNLEGRNGEDEARETFLLHNSLIQTANKAFFWQKISIVRNPEDGTWFHVASGKTETTYRAISFANLRELLVRYYGDATAEAAITHCHLASNKGAPSLSARQIRKVEKEARRIQDGNQSLKSVSGITNLIKSRYFGDPASNTSMQATIDQAIKDILRIPPSADRQLTTRQIRHITEKAEAYALTHYRLQAILNSTRKKYGDIAYTFFSEAMAHYGYGDWEARPYNLSERRIQQIGLQVNATKTAIEEKFSDDFIGNIFLINIRRTHKALCEKWEDIFRPREFASNFVGICPLIEGVRATWPQASDATPPDLYEEVALTGCPAPPAAPFSLELGYGNGGDLERAISTARNLLQRSRRFDAIEKIEALAAYYDCRKALCVLEAAPREMGIQQESLEGQLLTACTDQVKDHAQALAEVYGISQALIARPQNIPAAVKVTTQFAALAYESISSQRLFQQQQDAAIYEEISQKQLAWPTFPADDPWACAKALQRFRQGLLSKLQRTCMRDKSLIIDEGANNLAASYAETLRHNLNLLRSQTNQPPSVRAHDGVEPPAGAAPATPAAMPPAANSVPATETKILRAVALAINKGLRLGMFEKTIEPGDAARVPILADYYEAFSRNETAIAAANISRAALDAIAMPTGSFEIVGRFDNGDYMPQYSLAMPPVRGGLFGPACLAECFEQQVMQHLTSVEKSAKGFEDRLLAEAGAVNERPNHLREFADSIPNRLDAWVTTLEQNLGINQTLSARLRGYRFHSPRKLANKPELIAAVRGFTNAVYQEADLYIAQIFGGDFSYLDRRGATQTVSFPKQIEAKAQECIRTSGPITARAINDCVFYCNTDRFTRLLTAMRVNSPDDHIRGYLRSKDGVDTRLFTSAELRIMANDYRHRLRPTRKFWWQRWKIAPLR